MLIEQTLDKLNTMKLGAMADACQQQIQSDEAAAPSASRNASASSSTPSGRPASSASFSAGSAPPSCAIPPPSRPSTSRHGHPGASSRTHNR